MSMLTMETMQKLVRLYLLNQDYQRKSLVKTITTL